MAQTETWADFISLLQGITGAHAGFSAQELTSIQLLANDAARQVYLECQLWENFLVVGEQRHVNGSKVVPYELTGKNSVDTFFRVHNKDPWDTQHPVEINYHATGTGAELIQYAFDYNVDHTITTLVNLSGTVSCTISAANTDIAVGDSIQISGADVVDGVPDVNTTHTVTTVAGGGTVFGFTQTYASTYNWTIDDEETMSSPSVWVTYKNRLSDTYGENDTATIPREFYHYMAHMTAASLLAGDGFYERSVIQESRAKAALQRELERQDLGRAAETVFSRYRTHGSEQRQSVTVS